MSTTKTAPVQEAGSDELQSRQALELRASTYNEESRTVDALISKGSAVTRWWGTEKLEISEQAVDLTRVQSGLVNLLDTHNRWGIDAVLGRVTEAWISNGELWARFQFADTDAGREAEGMVSRGEIRGVSVGYAIHSFQVDKAESGKEEVRTAVKWELMEVSLVPVPADPESGIRSASGTQSRNQGQSAATRKDTPMTTPNTGGTSAEPETRDAPATAPAAPAPATTTPAPAPATNTRTHHPFSATDALSFVDVARGFGLADRATALVEEVAQDRMSQDSARSTILSEAAARQNENTRGITGGVRAEITADESDKFIRGATNSILMRAGMTEQVRAAAKKRGEEIDLDPGEFRSYRNSELATACLEHEGERSIPRGRDEVVAMAMTSTGLAGRSVLQSSSTFGIILENVMHKSMQSAYAVAPDTWRRFCGVGSVNDFRPHPKLLMGTFGKLDRLAETGELKNKTIPDAAKELVQAFEHGNIINLSRTAIVNDDMNVFNDVAVMFGRAAYLSIEIDVYDTLKANSGAGAELRDGNPLFHASRNNIGATGGAPGVEVFEEIDVLMSSQKDPSGNEVLDISPSIWVGPKGLAGEARVVNGAEFDTTVGTKTRKPNKVRGLFSDIVGTTRLSGTPWYAFADPIFNPAIQVSFLNGQQDPLLEMQDSWRTSGVEWRILFDYGVDPLNFRSAAMNAGQ